MIQKVDLLWKKTLSLWVNHWITHSTDLFKNDNSFRNKTRLCHWITESFIQTDSFRKKCHCSVLLGDVQQICCGFVLPASLCLIRPNHSVDIKQYLFLNTNTCLIYLIKPLFNLALLLFRDRMPCHAQDDAEVKHVSLVYVYIEI